LTKIEFAILALFFKNRGRVFSLEQIYEMVWKEDCILNAESTVSVHIRNLREKIEADMSNPQYIKTVWGVGYRVD
jgi:DNA-binding response OmpR family regulator